MTFDLESLNGQISSMRGSVKQVKTHLINKLTREAKKLREKKGTEEQKKQNQKKADRFIEEVMLLKKIQPDDVSKFVLKTENCENVISKPNIPLETKVLARFGTHKILSTVIDKFRSEHPAWKEVIEDLVQKVVSKPKQTIPARNTTVNRSIVKTPGNNIFSVTPVKNVASGNSQDSQVLNNKLGTPVSTKTIKNFENKQHPLSMEKADGKTFSKVNGAAGILKPKNLSQSSGKGPKKRKSFMDSSSNEEEETEDSDEFDKETFQKAFKRQKPEDESEDSEESVEEEEESSEDGMAEEGEDSGADSSEGDSEEESDEEESDSSSEKRNKGRQSSNKIQKGNKAAFTHNSGSSGVISRKDGSKDTSAPLAKNKKSKLDEELDEIERRLKKGKTNNRNLNTEDSPEESIDPFFITNDGKEYISTAPAPKNDDKPSPSNFSQNTSAPKEFYRKGKKITPTHGQNRNFNDRNNRGRGNYQNRFNDRNSQGNYGDHEDRNDRRSFNKNNGRNFSHNNRGNYSNVNDRRNSFHRNNDGNSDRNSVGNSSNYNDRRNSFNRNDGRGFNRNNRGKSFNYNDRRSAPGGSFNSKDRFDNSKQGPKFDSGRKSAGNTDHLHPSWEAKKKMSTLAPFQGIKTVFDN